MQIQDQGSVTAAFVEWASDAAVSGGINVAPSVTVSDQVSGSLIVQSPVDPNDPATREEIESALDRGLCTTNMGAASGCAITLSNSLYNRRRAQSGGSAAALLSFSAVRERSSAVTIAAAALDPAVAVRGALASGPLASQASAIAMGPLSINSLSYRVSVTAPTNADASGADTAHIKSALSDFAPLTTAIAQTVPSIRASPLNASPVQVTEQQLAGGDGNGGSSNGGDGGDAGNGGTNGNGLGNPDQTSAQVGSNGSSTDILIIVLVVVAALFVGVVAAAVVFIVCRRAKRPGGEQSNYYPDAISAAQRKSFDDRSGAEGMSGGMGGGMASPGGLASPGVPADRSYPIAGMGTSTTELLPSGETRGDSRV